jgi:hypothetical protein
MQTYGRHSSYAGAADFLQGTPVNRPGGLLGVTRCHGPAGLAGEILEAEWRAAGSSLRPILAGNRLFNAAEQVPDLRQGSQQGRVAGREAGTGQTMGATITMSGIPTTVRASAADDART